MERQAWEEYAEAEKYDSTLDKSFEIPYENEDTPQDKLDRISYLEREGNKRSLLEWEINDLDRLYMEMFGKHLSEDQKKLYR